MLVVKIGRNADNNIIFTDSTVSGNHADLYFYDDGSMQIVDHSSNGTYVNQTYIHGKNMALMGNEMLTFPGQNCLSVAQVAAHYNGTSAGTREPAFMPSLATRPMNQASNVNVNVQVGSPKNSYATDPTYAPKNLNSWCWGGFTFGWLWGVFNRVYWPLIIFIPFLGQVAALIIAFILGANGNRYAWDKFDESPARFEQKQHRWNVAAFIVWGISILGTLITIIVLVSAGSMLMNSLY